MLPQRPSPLRTAVERWRDHLLDADAHVDECRSRTDRVVDDLRAAVRERDRIAAHLKSLIDMAEPEAA